MVSRRRKREALKGAVACHVYPACSVHNVLAESDWLPGYPPEQIPMKIDQLPLGARFQWKGVTYTKVGPMTASGDTGGSAFIPKHASLQPVPGEAALREPQCAPKDKLVAARVIAAFEDYHQAALALLDESGRQALEQARKRFLSEIG